MNHAPSAVLNERGKTKRERSIMCEGEKKKKDSRKVKGKQECERRQRVRWCRRTDVCKEHKEGKKARVW